MTTYTTKNYPTKKALIEAVKRGEQVTVFNPGLGDTPRDGTVFLSGPHYPKPHTWYAQAIVSCGVIIKVK